MSEPENADKRLPLWARIMASIRYLMGLAVLGIFVGSTALLISGSVDMFTAVWRALSGTADYSEGLRLTLIESVDTVLVSTVLYMIAIGLYQLFIDPSLTLPRWIHTQGLGDLEKRLAEMVIARYASHPVAGNAANDPTSLPAYHALARYLLDAGASGG